jgi:hypothetical protein
MPYPIDNPNVAKAGGLQRQGVKGVTLTLQKPEGFRGKA